MGFLGTGQWLLVLWPGLAPVTVAWCLDSIEAVTAVVRDRRSTLLPSQTFNNGFVLKTYTHFHFCHPQLASVMNLKHFWGWTISLPIRELPLWAPVVDRSVLGLCVYVKGKEEDKPLVLTHGEEGSLGAFCRDRWTAHQSGASESQHHTEQAVCVGGAEL